MVGDRHPFIYHTNRPGLTSNDINHSDEISPSPQVLISPVLRTLLLFSRYCLAKLLRLLPGTNGLSKGLARHIDNPSLDCRACRCPRELRNHLQ